MNNYMSPVKEDKMQRHTGALELNCCTSKDPSLVLKSLEEVLQKAQVAYKKMVFGFRCQQQALRWDMEITQLEGSDQLFFLKLSRREGERKQYRAVCRGLLN